MGLHHNRRDFLATTVTGAAGLSLSPIPYLSKAGFLHSLTTYSSEIIGKKYTEFLIISESIRKSNILFKNLTPESKFQLERMICKTLGDLMFDNTSTGIEAKVKLESLYKTLSEIIKTNPKNLEKIIDNLIQSSSDKYYDRLANISEISSSLNYLIPYNRFNNDDELKFFNYQYAHFIKTLATRENLESNQCYELLKAFFDNAKNSIESNYRLNNRRTLVQQLSTPTT